MGACVHLLCRTMAVVVDGYMVGALRVYLLALRVAGLRVRVVQLLMRVCM